MEVLLLAAAAALGLIAWNHSQQAPLPDPGGGPPPDPGPSPGPSPTPGPGVYPAGTPGAIPIQLTVLNPGGAEWVKATPGGTTYGSTTIWYGPGTPITVQAGVDWWAFWAHFDHYEGPGGVSTKQNPINERVLSAGYVRAVFSSSALPL